MFAQRKCNRCQELLNEWIACANCDSPVTCLDIDHPCTLARSYCSITCYDRIETKLELLRVGEKIKCIGCGRSTLIYGDHPCQLRCFICNTWMIYPLYDSCDDCDERIRCLSYPNPIGWDPEYTPKYTIKGTIKWRT